MRKVYWHCDHFSARNYCCDRYDFQMKIKEIKTQQTALTLLLYIYHFSTVVDFSFEKYSGSTGEKYSGSTRHRTQDIGTPSTRRETCVILPVQGHSRLN